MIRHLEELDKALSTPALLCVYGSAAFILLDEPERTSLDIDVAGPYSQADMADLGRAAGASGIPINPEETSQSDHLEWRSAVRLCLTRPDPRTEIILWGGRLLTVKTVSIPDLIASKLIRYDPVDQSDIQYLLTQRPFGIKEISEAVERLPSPFDADPIVLDNLQALRQDLTRWRYER